MTAYCFGVTNDLIEPYSQRVFVRKTDYKLLGTEFNMNKVKVVEVT